MNFLRVEPVGSQLPLVNRRRQRLLRYTQQSTSMRPYVSYKILKLAGRKARLKRKHALSNVLRFTRKLQKLTPSFKQAESYRTSTYGSLEALPATSKHFFIFKKHDIKIHTQDATFLTPAGYLAPMDILNTTYTHLYLLSTFTKTFYQLIDSFQSPYFQAFLKRWDVLTQLL